jgi:hypothetical protein
VSIPVKLIFASEERENIFSAKFQFSLKQWITNFVSHEFLRASNVFSEQFLVCTTTGRLYFMANSAWASNQYFWRIFWSSASGLSWER